ncbi:glyoxalase [Kocuria koreensis]|jgi:catechol 2,3-dioxygenase-like lactoylglutathione lyase family enzyme|uniref:Glyoxalase n=1 Tax=Rothia koreensis TaxID=592378 RepID=A0A7K1LGN1_9MICC|nr:VOC family protein [Rothia koreensis]MUN54345.1 glyoxalase [Rothia koreensis]
MEQRISLITLATSDLDASRRFYVDGLGWAPDLEADDVLMMRAGEHLILSLWRQEAFEEEVGAAAPGPGLVPLTLAHNVGSAEEVDGVLRGARETGAPFVSVAAHREWGGYSGYFADPDGYRWEIAWAPGPVNDAVLP